MNKLIKKIKYNILYKKINYPLLQIVKKDEYSFFDTKEILFEQKDICTLKDLISINKKYNTIIIEEPEDFPTEIIKLLNKDGVLYVFTTQNDKLLFELSKYFKFVKENILNIKMEIIPEENKNIIEFSSSDTSQVINLITANNFEPVKINNSALLSMNYLNSYLKKDFVERDEFLKEIKTHELLKTKLIKFKKTENILLQKQKVIKSTINDFLNKILQNENIINKNNKTLTKYKSYIDTLINILITHKNFSDLNEINNLDKLVKTNMDLINSYVKLNREIQKNKSETPRSSLKIIIEESSGNLDEIKKLYEENNNLIEQNNLYVSEISHLKFDIDEVNEKNKELIILVKELENQLKELESQKDMEFSEILKTIKKEYEQKVLQLLEKNKKLNKEFNDLNHKVEKLGEKNIKNLSLLDEKSVLIQKLKLKLEKIKEDINLKEELLNKKNLIIREHENRIAVLEDEIKNKDLLYVNLKKELNENNKKINSTYYKELYDDLQKKYKKIKNKNKELVNITQDYKREIEQYEIKIQELVGYNERITRDIDIDLDTI